METLHINVGGLQGTTWAQQKNLQALYHFIFIGIMSGVLKGLGLSPIEKAQ
jgi:hypothetical protein